METVTSFLPYGTVLSALVIILVLGGLIFIHELGHFLAAKFFRIGVKTFSLGFGPRLAGFTRGNTAYQIAALPLGGYVSMVGESDPEDIPEPFSAKDSFALRPPWQRLIVIAAGPLCNLALACLIYWGVFYTHGEEYLLPVIGNVQAESPAERAGLQTGDVIVSIDGTPLTRWEDMVVVIRASQGRDMRFAVTRDGRDLALTAKATPLQGSNLFGETVTSWAVGITPSGASEVVRLGFFEAGRRGVGQVVFITKLIGQSIQKMFQRVVPLDSMAGPVRIARDIHDQVQAGSLLGIFMLAAFISLNLGLLNLLPIPVLDGGHILFLLFEMVRRKPASERFQEITAQVGVALLLGLMLFVTYNDISKWIQGKL